MDYQGYNVTVKKGIYYFPTYQLARDYMREHSVGLRIVEYQLGYAIQLQLSGSYVGCAK